MQRETGLINLIGDDPAWVFDTSSIETFGSSWSNFGYEIIYRPEEIRASDKVVAELQKAFMRPFGLPNNQYSFEPTFWRVYWDKGMLKASTIKKCDKELDAVAKKNNVAVRLNGVIIQPRPDGYVKKQIADNKNYVKTNSK